MTAASAAPEPAPDAVPGAVWTVAAVSRRFGVAPSTLRTWSLRHGIGPTGHHPGRHRRYTDTDVAELETMLGLAEEGVTLTAAAAIARRQRRTGSRRAAPVGPDAAQAAGSISPRTVALLVRAAQRLDSTSATNLISAALGEHGVVAAWDTLCRPAFTALTAAGGAGTDGSGCLEALLLLQWAVATSLRRIPVPPTVARARQVLLACAEGEHHTLAMEALHAALIERQVDARMLGASVPEQALLTATATLEPATVVVWAQTTETAAPDPLHALIGAAASPDVVAAGPGWDDTLLRSPIARAASLPEAVALSAGGA